VQKKASRARYKRGKTKMRGCGGSIMEKMMKNKETAMSLAQNEAKTLGRG